MEHSTPERNSTQRNTVQQSQYATIFGIHIGILGIVGYALLLGGWIVARKGKGRLAYFGAVVSAAIAAGGTLFSIYLTFLEPFVIGATCMWCLTSAVAITGLFWLTADGGWAAYRRLVGVEEPAASPTSWGPPFEISGCRRSA